MKRFLPVLIAGTMCQPALAETTDAQLQQKADEAFERLAPVGMAVAVVRPGQPVWVRGYGALAAGRSEAVSGDTVFPIHSMTKSFTAAALALLVDEGKVAWTDPVRKHIPEFAMSDPYVTEHLTVRDLLVHNSGLALGAGDLLHWPDQVATADEFIAALPHLPLEKGFREGFAYDNILYTVAGEVVERVSGTSWAEFVETRLFAPLGMTSCSTSAARARKVPTVTQHSRVPGGAPTRRGDIVLLEDPAGSISCSVKDVAKWTQFQIGDGKLADGTVLISPDRLREMHRPVVALGPPNFMRRLAGAHFNDVALGWFVSDFAGSLAVEHGGLGAGGVTNMILLPEQDAVVVVLVNDLAPAQFLSHQLADLIVRGDKASDWIGFVVEGEKRRAARAQQETTEQSQPPAGAAPPAHRLADYAGTYRDPWYGDIVVSAGKEGLTLHLTRSKLLKGPLVPWNGETFLARWPDRSLDADALVTFITDATGKVSGMKLVAASERTDFSYDYHHLAPKRMRE